MRVRKTWENHNTNIRLATSLQSFFESALYMASNAQYVEQYTSSQGKTGWHVVAATKPGTLRIKQSEFYQFRLKPELAIIIGMCSRKKAPIVYSTADECKVAWKTFIVVYVEDQDSSDPVLCIAPSELVKLLLV